jgi:hypothetical protein
MEDKDKEKLLKDLDMASTAVKRQSGGKPGEGAEKVYAIAYQKCVQAGLKPKLRNKYR